MIGFIVFGGIIALAVFISRKNLKARQSEMQNNFLFAKQDLKNTYNNLTEKQQLILRDSLSSKELNFLQTILRDEFKDNNNLWSAQQSIILVQDLLIKINKL